MATKRRLPAAGRGPRVSARSRREEVFTVKVRVRLTAARRAGSRVSPTSWGRSGTTMGASWRSGRTHCTLLPSSGQGPVMRAEPSPPWARQFWKATPPPTAATATPAAPIRNTFRRLMFIVTSAGRPAYRIAPHGQSRAPRPR